MSDTGHPEESLRDDDLREIKAVLTRYRPASPPASMRLSHEQKAPEGGHAPVIGWVSLAAALVAMILQWATTAVYRDVTTRVVAPSLAERQAVIDAVAQTFGSGLRARVEAERLVMAAEEDRVEHDQRLVEVSQ